MHLCSFNLSVTQRKGEGCGGGGKEGTKRRGRKKENKGSKFGHMLGCI